MKVEWEAHPRVCDCGVSVDIFLHPNAETILFNPESVEVLEKKSPTNFLERVVAKNIHRNTHCVV